MFGLTTNIDYTIKGFLSKTYGKLHGHGKDKYNMMMEFEYWLPTWANNTDFSYWMDAATEVQWKAYLNTPNLSFQYSRQVLANMPSPRYKAYEHSNFEEI